jgi:signal peptidase I
VFDSSNHTIVDIDIHTRAYYSELLRYSLKFAVRVIGAPVFMGFVLLSMTLDVVQIEGRSMEPLVSDGRNVIVLRTAYGIQFPLSNRYLVIWDKPELHDIILLTVPGEYRSVVKRVAGTGGDPVLFTDDTVMILNDRRIVVEPDTVRQVSAQNRIPEGTVFVLGDNDALSRDSRQFGVIPMQNVHGRVVVCDRM